METEKLVAHARARFDHAAAKRTLKEKYEAKLLLKKNENKLFNNSKLFLRISCTKNQSMSIGL